MAIFAASHRIPFHGKVALSSPITRHFKHLVGVAPGRYASDRKKIQYGTR